MFFQYRYLGSSASNNSSQSTKLSFAPDTLRQPTYFIGELAQTLQFREAISALNAVVVSDLRYQASDKTAYQHWLAQQQQAELNELLQNNASLLKQYHALNQQYQPLLQKKRQLQRPYYQARNRYFNYLYKRDYNAWFVLDPVITIHPDQLFFECFSQDESSYGQLSCNYNVFKKISEFACGTTNIDYSAELYNEFQKIRDYKTTSLTIDPSGFDIKTAADSYQEVKIDLPDSWVRGFLQVSSAMTLPAYVFQLHPMDIYNLCLFLRRNKEKTGPRALCYCLTPDQPIAIKIEPWNKVIVCPRSIYQGNTAIEIRVWGRRRLHILERLIPITQSFTVYLMGTGMPSFYIADLGDMAFTLGLSGWTANDWTNLAQFDLMKAKTEVDQTTQNKIFAALKTNWQESVASLAKRLSLDTNLITSTLSNYTQAGRVIYDLNNQVYRVRELSQNPLPTEQLRFTSPAEAKANQLITKQQVKIGQYHYNNQQAFQLHGQVSDQNKTYSVKLTIDTDQTITQASCECSFYKQNKLYQGPCAHMLALHLLNSKIQNQTQTKPKANYQLAI